MHELNFEGRIDEDVQRPNPVRSADTLSGCPVVTCDAA